MKAYGGFSVEEYRKPEYEVKVTPEQRRMVQGGRMKLTIEARYYYGEPVAGGKLTYVVHRSRYWLPWYEIEEDLDERGQRRCGGEQISEQKAVLDAQGRLTSMCRHRAASTMPPTASRRVSTDSSNREVSGVGAFVATRGPFYVNAQPARYVYGPGDAGTHPCRNTRLRRQRRSQYRPSVWRSRRIVSRVRAGSRISTREGRTGADGKGTVEFPAPPSGSYDMRAIVPESGGRRTSRHDLAVGIGRVVRRRLTPNSAFRLCPTRNPTSPARPRNCSSRQAYRIAICGSRSKAKRIYWSKFISVKGGTVTVDVPIESSHAPNVFVEAVFVSNNTLYRGSKSLKVPPVEKQIQVEVQSAKPEYKPGEPATFTVLAKDYQGKPLSAEFSLGIVDEAIYAVRKETQPTSSRFSTDAHTIASAPTRRWIITSLAKPERGACNSRRYRLSSHARSSNPSAWWNPRSARISPTPHTGLPTSKPAAMDARQAQVSFPDSLTTWRATARGVTQDSKVGDARQRTIVRKNLLVTMATPRFFTEGDEVTVPVLVRNYLATEQKVRVSLDAQGMQMLSGATAEITVAPKGEGRVEYRLRANANDKAVLTAKALSSVESDALELTLPVEPYGLKVTDAVQKRFDADSSESRVPVHFSARCFAELARRHGASDAFCRGRCFRCARLSGHLSLRLHGADHVQLPAERRRDAGSERTEAAVDHRPKRSQEKGYRRIASGSTISSTKTAVGAGGKAMRAMRS